MRRLSGRWYFHLLAGLALLLPVLAGAQSAAPTAQLDRTSVRLGETVSLQVSAEGQGLAMPDFSPLSVDFEILSTGTSSQLSLIGGQSTARTTWTLELEPRRSGVLRIPPIPVGARATAALALTVSEAPAAAGDAGEDVFLEIEIDPREPYVQQPVQMVIRLFYAVGLTEGNLREPDVEDATLTRLGQDRNYAAERHGRRYQVVERVFSLRPERSGSVRVGATTFQGRAMRANARRLLDPGVRVTARTAPTVLTVRPRPAQSSGDWLPARSLHMEDELGPDPAAARVGEPLTRTVRLYVEGLALDQLPDLVHPELADAQIYADRPLGHGRDSGGWPSAEREFRFAVVPGKPGELVLPELKLAWWDVIADQPRQAVVPARRVQVAAGAVAVAIPEASAATPAQTEDAASGAAIDPGLWPWLSLILGTLWLATLLGWWRSRRLGRARTSAAKAGEGDGVPQRRFREALAGRDAAATLSALLAWARSRDASIRDLAELTARLSPQRRELVRALEASRYAREQTPADALWERIDSAFPPGADLIDDGRSEDTAADGLPPLWPQRR